MVRQLGADVTVIERPVASAVFTAPEIATVGVTQRDVDAGLIAVRNTLTAEQLADAFTVCPSLSGSIAEADRRLHRRDDDDFNLY